jgi:hypothetical protein
MNWRYLQLFQLVLQAIIIVLLVRSKKKSAALSEPARSERNYMLNAAVVAGALVVGLLIVELVVRASAA